MNTRRRWLAAGAALPALAWSGALRAQTHPPVVIGFLSAGNPAVARNLQTPFTEGLAALGWKRGERYVLEERHADGQVGRLPALAQELAAWKPAVIVAWPSASARAAADAAPTTPIVLVSGDPLRSGLVTSLARPGGMITGTSNMTAETTQKAIEMLVESRPLLERVGFLVDSTSPNHGATVADARRAASHLRFEAVIADLAGPQDIEPAFARLAKANVQAVVVMPSGWFNPHVPTIVASAMAQRWPAIGSQSAIPARGGLFSYAADGPALARRAAHYVDRILKGAKPGDLPIEQPTTFELILNLKTAKALGITMPPSILLRATRVIE